MERQTQVQIPDLELITRCRQGDEDAFQILYQRYRLPLFSYLHKLLPGQNALVDDMFQQTWIKAVRNWEKYSHQQKLLAWLCRIAHNLVMDHFRSKAQMETVELSDIFISSYDSAETLMDQETLETALQQAISELSAEQQEVLELRRKGVSFKEIARIQNTNINTVLGRMHYAIKNLKDKLASYL